MPSYGLIAGTASADIFDFQDEITARVALSIEPAIRQAEVLQSRRKRPESLDAHDLVLLALPHLYAIRAGQQRG